MTAPVAVPVAPALARWNRVEIAKAGTYEIQVGGEQTFTADDFAAAIAAVDCPAIGRPVLKLGHQDARGFGLRLPGADPHRDGEPALGWATNLTLDAGRQTLVADLVGMPGWFGQIAASAYPSRSIEGARDYRCARGHTHPFVISAVAMLGVTPPAMQNLGSLQDHVRALYGVAAAASPDMSSGEPFAVTFPASKERPVADEPMLIAAAVTTDDVRKAFYADAPADAWVCEIQLDPLQLIVQRDDGDYARVPVTVNSDGSFSFGPMIDVEVTYVDESPAQEAAEDDDNALVAAAVAAPQRVRFTPRSAQVVAATGDEPPNDPTHTPAKPAATPQTDPLQAPTAPPSPAQPVTPTDPGAPTAPVVPAAEPATTTEPEGGTDVSLSEFCSRLGLDETADEAAVLAALDELKTKATTPAEPPAELVAAAAKADKQAEQFAAAIGQIETLSTELAAVKAEKAAERKAAFFAAAVGQGKIAPAERASWEARYDRDAELVSEILAAIKPGTAVPVAAAGYMGDPEPAFSDDDLLRLLPPDMRSDDAKAGV